MHWKCAGEGCDSASFKLIHYTPAAMSVLCAKCGKRHTNLNPKWPLLINSAPQTMELKITDANLIKEISELRTTVEQMQQRMEKDAS